MGNDVGAARKRGSNAGGEMRRAAASRKSETFEKTDLVRRWRIGNENGGQEETSREKSRG
jgi:hypothetical protein